MKAKYVFACIAAVPVLAMGAYVAWLVVPAVVATVVPAVVKATH